MAKKDLTPQERYCKANKDINKAIKKRDKIKKRKVRTTADNEEIERLTRTIAQKIEEKNIAKAEILNPPKVPQYYDTSKTTIIQTEINAGKNKNSKTANFTPQFIKKDNKSNTKQSNKKSKVKFYFYLIVAIVMLAGVIALTVHITNCVNGCKENSSTVQQAIVI